MGRLFFIFSGAFPKRWLLLLSMALLLHVLVVYWTFSYLATSYFPRQERPVITVELHYPSTPKTIEAVPAALSEPALTSSQPAGSKPKITTSSSELVKDSKIAQAPSPHARRIIFSDTPLIAQPKTSELLSSFQTNTPPSAKLQYRIQSLLGGQLLSGSGRLTWVRSNRKTYIDGEFHLQDSEYLRFLSEGLIDPQYGVSPIRYTETRNELTETKTQFDHERHTISFPASGATYPLHGGEQDTASVIWQLAGIGRHDATAFKADAEFQMFVAGASKADVWLIRVIGQEEVDTPMGKIQAWHLTRTAPAGSDEQSVDIWLAPEKEWYPVKLRYTEANGDMLELSVSEITLVPDT